MPVVTSSGVSRTATRYSIRARTGPSARGSEPSRAMESVNDCPAQDDEPQQAFSRPQGGRRFVARGSGGRAALPDRLNGAGKSTFFRLILGRYPPTAVPLLAARTSHSCTPCSYRRASASRCRFLCLCRAAGRKNSGPSCCSTGSQSRNLTCKIDRLLALVDLTAEAAKQAGQLAHGQQQWLEIAMAIGARPKLLLLDEPTAGMSPEET